ncbi:MAG: hypothetical protein Q8Q12_05845 [bacterium]|nr:hypothetical protein [bacterium]
MLVKTVCSKCCRRICLVTLPESVMPPCPQCGEPLKPAEPRTRRRKTVLDSLLESIPLTEVGSRERPFYLEEEELLLLGRCLVESVSQVGEWAKRSREQLEREAQEIKRVIAYLEEKGRDPLLRKIEFVMLSSFIRNYYG